MTRQPRGTLGACAAVTLAALALYHRTLLPGFDLGDTGSFQAVAASLPLRARDAYPLYFAVGRAGIWLTGGDPARALNLTSAIAAALACGVVTWATATLTASSAAGFFSGLLLAASYTFWSQAIIAEVYALHLLMVGLTLSALLAWSRRPSTLRLAGAFAVYALGFCNHLSMILLAPGLVLFLVLSAPHGWRDIVRLPTIVMAVTIAILGALPYLWNFLGLWNLPDRPATLVGTLQAFWFEVTKADWREAMVLGIGRSALSGRWPQLLFDLRQQFGITGGILALIGAWWLARTAWRAALLLAAWYLANVAFAMTYNVGDAYVFLLPSHLVAAIAAGAGVAALGRMAVSRTATSPGLRGLATTLPILWCAYPVWGAVDTLPAVDRHEDRRPFDVIARVTEGLDPFTSVLITDINWQVQNGLSYYGEQVDPSLAWTRAAEVIGHLPSFVADNAASGRRIVASEGAAAAISAAYGDLFEIRPDPSLPATRLGGLIAGLPPGTPYLLAVLAPDAEMPVNEAEVTDASRRLGRVSLVTGGLYNVMAGLTGSPPSLLTSTVRPTRLHHDLAGLTLDIRMESWLPADTIRRAGFGHVIVNRHRVLTLERGVSFVALNAQGEPIRAGYAFGLLAPTPRFLISPRQVADAAEPAR